MKYIMRHNKIVV